MFSDRVVSLWQGYINIRLYVIDIFKYRIHDVTTLQNISLMCIDLFVQRVSETVHWRTMHIFCYRELQLFSAYGVVFNVYAMHKYTPKYNLLPYSCPSELMVLV